MTEFKRPKVFISYAWEDDTKIWVRELAIRLRSDGIDATLDDWTLSPGDLLPEFMEKAVSQNDFVLVVCTPKYKEKSDSNKPSGVKFEKGIITGELFSRHNHRKFIPILQKDTWQNAAPTWASGKVFIDLRGETYKESEYEYLVKTLYGKKETAPPLGPIPSFVTGNKEKALIVEAEKVMREKAEKEAAERAAREKAKKETAKKAAREKEKKVAAEKNAREKAKKEASEKSAREKAEKESAEKAAQEKVEKETAEKVAKEKAEKEAAEKATKEKADREVEEAIARAEVAAEEAIARAKQLSEELKNREQVVVNHSREFDKKAIKEKAEKEKAKKKAAEKAAREKAKKEAAEISAQEKAERREARRTSITSFFSQTTIFLKSTSFLRIFGIIGVTVLLVWGIPRATPKPFDPTPTAKPSSTATFTATIRPSPTKTFTPVPTKTSPPTLTSIPQSSILYEEDFEDGEAQGWTDSIGTKSVEEDEDGNFYFKIAGPDNYPQSWLDSDYIDMSDWTDYAFETRVRFISGTLFMCARADGGTAFYTFYTFSNDNHISLSEYDVDKNIGWGGYDIDKNYTINHNKWYTFRFELNGSILSLYIDDNLVITTEANLPLVRESGGIGFYIGGNEEVHFDNIRVWSLR